jgi:hypothetical protein
VRLAREVSLANDDGADNCFLPPLGPFSQIEEDAPARCVTASNHGIALGRSADLPRPGALRPQIIEPHAEFAVLRATMSFQSLGRPFLQLENERGSRDLSDLDLDNKPLNISAILVFSPACVDGSISRDFSAAQLCQRCVEIDDVPSR